MPPRTRRSQTVNRLSLDNTHRLSSENVPPISLATHGNTVGQHVTTSNQPNAGQNKRKRAVSHTASKIATNLPGPADPRAMKRARDINGRPIALESTGQGDTEEDDVVKRKRHTGKQRDLAVGQRRDQSSLQTDHDHDAESLLAVDPDMLLDDFNVDGNIESADDWFGDEPIVELSQKNPSKISKAMTIERPIWSGPGTSSTLSFTGSSSSTRSITEYPLTQAVVGPSSTLSVGDPTPSMPSVDGLTPTWSFGVSSQASSTDLPSAPPPTPTIIAHNVLPELPTENGADLVFLPGSNKVMLTLQRPLVRAVIQDSFDHLRASIVFTNAFPDGSLAVEFVKDSLVLSAISHAPGARYIYQRLLYDEEYLLKIIPLPRARISLYRSEIKERCCAIVGTIMAEIGDPLEIARIVEKQLTDYRYTYPRAPGFSISNGLVMRTRPYRNSYIITVIGDMFFSGGSGSFAARHEALFPKHDDGTSVTREVPIVMVSIVATGLYAAFHEWRSGEPQHVDFSANSFLDVYAGHINTLQHIQDRKEASYHQMMAAIYTSASTTFPGIAGTGIAHIDLEGLE